ncbi:hypothetical protein EJ04DRAFT_605508 [Polyplosphaeria fusca]|uniref:Copper-fist domain-containing protein n=1 Tax=Polyplosphaeria fusca TaxID=682080 RepID=A0A9P4V2L0_9PLEO|nr:hypothetical protein EJ04DRAFT_605508 [Polyplosphaeria fusca]
MPLIKGEKYACTSCIKGHRVSGCNHNDRELHHINPKGRPVKQCEHCRTARKSKSHHAKCDCGEKKDKDKHKDKGDAKGEISSDTSPGDISNLDAVEEGSCCCHSGSKCICGVKKEPFDLKLDTGKLTLHGARAKPKLTATHSESILTVFANGHHKPCHRNNNSAHVSGAPYKIPRPHSLHGSYAFDTYSQCDAYGLADLSAQRSVDTHSLSNTDYYAMFGSSQRSLTGLPMTPLTASLDDSGVQESLFNSQTSAFGQDGASPSDSQTSDSVVTQWPWATPTTATPMNRNFALGSLSTSPSQDCLPNLESDQWALSSAGLNPWSANDLPLDSSKLVDSLAQPISHSGESKQSAPGMTTASSSQSELGEPALFGDLELRMPQSAVSETIFWEDSNPPVYRTATSLPSEVRPAPTSIPATTGAEGSPFTSGIGFNVNALAFSNVSVEDLQAPKDLSATPVTMSSTIDFDEPRAIMMPNNIDDVVSNDPWLMDPTNMFVGVDSLDASYSNWP